MKTYLSHISALYFWRQRSVEHFATFPRSRKQVLADCCPSAKELDGRFPNSLYFGPGKKHVLVPGPEYRVSEDEFEYHVCTSKLPPHSLIELDERTYVSSPECCFLQMATLLSVAGMVLLGLELCGHYRLELGREAEYKCPPLTTPRRLKCYLKNARGCYGHRKAERSLRWILADSASPRESLSFSRFCLSNNLGGYAFPLPLLNGEMPFNEIQRELAERSTSYGDLYWPEKDVTVEYFGKNYHTGEERMERDAKRNNALADRSSKIFTITDDIYDDMGKFDALARSVARALGFRVNTRVPDLALRNWELMNELVEQEALTHPDEDAAEQETQGLV